MTDPFAPPPAGATPPPRPVVEPPAFGEPVPTGRNNGIGTAALVLGIAAVPFCWLVIPGILAVVFGLVGRARAKRGEANNGGVALAGVITGTIGLLLSALLIVGLVKLAGSPAFDRFNTCYDAAQTSSEQDACVQTLMNELTD